MASTNATTAARDRLQKTALGVLSKLTGFDLCDDADTSEIKVDAPKKRHNEGTVKEGCRPLADRIRVRFMIRAFIDRLPLNHGAQLGLEELYSFVRFLAERKEEEDILEAIICYCEAPPFVDLLAAFGRLPNYPYILTFDPYAYQSPGAAAPSGRWRALKIPPGRCILPPQVPQVPQVPETQSVSLTPTTKATSTASGESDHVRDLESQETMLVEIFNEEHRASGVRCATCHETKYINVRTVQARSADEGSSYIYHCLRCNQIARDR